MTLKKHQKRLLMTVLTLFCLPAWAIEVELVPQSQTVSEGYFDLRWNKINSNQLNLTGSASSVASQFLRLQISGSESFKSLIKDIAVSSENAISLSGYSDGTYFVRIVNSRGELMSDVSTVTVSHRSLSFAYLLFALGAGLFVILLCVLFNANKLHPRD